jgi:hypothetical protein
MKVAVLTPVFAESAPAIAAHYEAMDNVAGVVAGSGIDIEVHYLNDGAAALPDSLPRLVDHPRNLGLVSTLIDGYQAALTLNPAPDIVIRMDCVQHDPEDTLTLIEHLQPKAGALVSAVPFAWGRMGESNPSLSDIERAVRRVATALAPIRGVDLEETYFVHVECAHQAYQLEALQHLIPYFIAGARFHAEAFHAPMRWGLDLLALLIAANAFKEKCLIVGPRPKLRIGQRRRADETHIPQRTKDVLLVAAKLQLPLA